ncbi:hypothetical protein AB0F74_37450, partial [Nocardia salmonicida]
PWSRCRSSPSSCTGSRRSATRRPWDWWWRHHLLLLADAGLVDAEKVGRQRIYRVLPSGLAKLQAEIDKFWTDELDLLVADAHDLRRNR